MLKKIFFFKILKFLFTIFINLIVDYTLNKIGAISAINLKLK